MNQKTNKYTSGKLEEGKPQKIGDSINNYSAGARRCSIKKTFYERLVKITGKYLCRILFLYKVSDLLLNRYFPVNFAKKFKEIYFSEHFCWLLLSDVAKLKENRTHTT